MFTNPYLDIARRVEPVIPTSSVYNNQKRTELYQNSSSEKNKEEKFWDILKEILKEQQINNKIDLKLK